MLVLFHDRSPKSTHPASLRSSLWATSLYEACGCWALDDKQNIWDKVSVYQIFNTAFIGWQNKGVLLTYVNPPTFMTSSTSAAVLQRSHVQLKVSRLGRAIIPSQLASNGLRVADNPDAAKDESNSRNPYASKDIASGHNLKIVSLKNQIWVVPFSM